MRWVLIALTTFAVLLHLSLLGFQEQCARQEIQRLREQIALAERLSAVERAHYQAAIFTTVQGAVAAAAAAEVQVAQLPLDGDSSTELAQRGEAW